MVEADFPGAPRVNASMVAAFAGKPVVLVGKVCSVEAGKAVLTASDGGDVSVTTQTSFDYAVDSFVEVVGMANADGSVREEASSSWGTKLDMDSYNGLVVLASDKYAHLFGGAPAGSSST